MTLNAADVSTWIGRLWWPVLRVGGLALTAPVFSEIVIPRKVKIVLTLSLALLMAPLAQAPAALLIFSGLGLLAAVQELLIGVSIGCLLYTSPSPRDGLLSRMPSSA